MDETEIGRYWEVDFLRGIAVFMMISFHALFDLDYFSGTADVHSGIWPLFAEATAGKGFLGLKHTRRRYREELMMPGALVNRREGDSSEAMERCLAEVERLLGDGEAEPLAPEVSAALDEILEAEFRAAGA